jgi:hypothetical protein
MIGYVISSNLVCEQVLVPVIFIGIRMEGLHPIGENQTRYKRYSLRKI